MAVTKLMGEHYRVFKGGSAVAEESNCSVTIQGNLEESGSKDVTGSYSKQDMVSKQWSVQVDSQDATLATLRGMITAFNSDNKVTVGWDQADGTNNQEAQNADFARSGSAILNDLSIVMNNRQPIS